MRCGSHGPEEGAAGLSRAPLWGLVRSARAEHPERRLRLLDVDAPISEAALLARLLSTATSRSWRLGTVRCWRRGWCVLGRGRVHLGCRRERRTTALRLLTPVDLTE